MFSQVVLVIAVVVIGVLYAAVHQELVHSMGPPHPHRVDDGTVEAAHHGHAQIGCRYDPPETRVSEKEGSLQNSPQERSWNDEYRDHHIAY